MSRVLLIHWKESELPERVAALRKAGCDVTTHSSQAETPALTPAALPEAILIDLSRLPSHGRSLGYVICQKKATRNIPLIFVGGAAGKVAAVRGLLPDATFTTWESVGAALRRAIARPPAQPIVPKSTSGYSGTPLPKKLGADKAETIALLGAPKGFEKLISVPDGPARIRRGGRAPAELVIWFVKSQAELRRGLSTAKKSMADGAGLWACWPKKSSSIKSDLSDGFVRESLLNYGLVDYKVCAIDETWSGLKFARRRTSKT